MIPEEMYETLDETSLEHWVMELPEDEAGCGVSSCARAAEWWGAFLPCGHGNPVCNAHMESLSTEFERLLDADRLSCMHCYTQVSDLQIRPI